MLYLVLIGGSLALGLVVGRWWTLVLPIGLGVWVGLSEEVDVPGWFLGGAYATLAGLGVVLGVVVRGRLENRGERS
jgi:hypothetical protein